MSQFAKFKSVKHDKTNTTNSKPDLSEGSVPEVEEDSTDKPLAAAVRQGRGPSQEAIARRKRFVRKPVSRRRFVLEAASDDPSMRLAWARNTPERVGPLLERGYEPVRGEIDAVSGHILAGENVGATITRRVGQGEEFILLQVPREWYDADQREKHREIEAKEAALKQQNKTLEGGYGDLKIGAIKKEPTALSSD